MQQELLRLPNGTVIKGQGRERYLVEGLLGKGGSSTVYLVRARHDGGRIFALKELINPDTQARSHLAFEAELLTRLVHASLPHIHHVFENVKLKRVYMVMDYIAGKDLEVLREEQPEKRFPVALALTLLTPIVHAVIYLHSQIPPVIHRDIKPANILVPVGGDETILVDFGLAKEYVRDKTTNTLRYGTPGYAAPEQYGHGTGPHTDLYALAATLYTLVTGVVPTDATIRSVEMQHTDPVKPAHRVCPHVPLAVSQVIERAMRLRSEERYTNVHAFWMALSLAATQSLPTEVSRTNSHDAPLPFTVTLHDAQLRLSSSTHLSPLRRIANQFPLAHTRIFRTVIFLLLALLLIGGMIDALLFYTVWSRPTPPKTVHHRVTGIAADCSPTSASIDPIQQDSLYPQLAPCYGGTIYDPSVASEQTPFYLTRIEQSQNHISGNFRGLGLVGTFTGTVTKDSKVQFTVSIPGREYKLFFYDGSIKFGGDIESHFHIIDSSGQITGEDGHSYLQNITHLIPTPTPPSQSG